MDNVRSMVYVALISNIMTFLIKIVASIMTGSAAMLAETLRSFSDIINQVSLVVGINLGSQKPSSKYPFGRGKEVFFWSFIASLFVIGGSGVLSLIEGINRILQPKSITSGEVAFIALGFALIFEIVSLVNALQTYRHQKNDKYDGSALRVTRNPMMIIVFAEDISAIIEIIVVFASIYVSIYLGILFFDGIAAIFIGLTMIGIGLHIANQTKEHLIGIGLQRHDIENIRKIILSVPQVNSVVDIKSVIFGVDRVILGIDVNFKDKLTTDEIEHAIDEIEHKIKQFYPYIKHIYIEAEDKHVK